MKLHVMFDVWTFHCSWQHVAWNVAFEASYSGHDTGGGMAACKGMRVGEIQTHVPRLIALSLPSGRLILPLHSLPFLPFIVAVRDLRS